MESIVIIRYYYTVIDYSPYTVLFIFVTYNWKFVCLNPLHLFAHTRSRMEIFLSMLFDFSSMYMHVKKSNMLLPSQRSNQLTNAHQLVFAALLIGLTLWWVLFAIQRNV